MNYHLISTMITSTKQPKDADGMNSLWISLDNIGSGFGHGVEFHHDDCVGPVAFLEGFEWFHGRANMATVRILTPDAERFGESSINGKMIVNETEEAILFFLKHPSLWGGDYRQGKVFVWFNG